MGLAPSNMWQAEHAAAMCRALQGQATTLPKAPAAQSSSNRPAASLALLHSGLRAWCSVVVAPEPHSSALRVYDRGENTALAICPADLEALHLRALRGDGGTALYLQGTVVSLAAVRFCRQSGGDDLRLVVEENVAPWLRAFSASRCKVEGDWEKFADAWRRLVEEHFPVGGMLHLPQPLSVPPVRPAAPAAAVAKPVPKGAPKPPPKKGLPHQYGNYANIRYVLRHVGGELATEQRGSKEFNVCPWSRLEGAGHCLWRAGKHLRPARLHPKDLLDHLARDKGSDPAQRDEAMAMINGVMPGGQAGLFASAQARSRALALPAGARPARAQGASQSATSSGARGSAAVSSTGSTGASASGSGVARSAAMSSGTRPATISSTGARRGSVFGCAQRSSYPLPAPGAGGPPPSGDHDPPEDPDPAAQP